MIRYFIVASLLLSLSLFAQDDDAYGSRQAKRISKFDPKVWKSGYVLSPEGDTIFGLLRIEHTLFYDYYNHGIELMGKDRQVIFYTPKELKGYCYSDSLNGKVEKNVFIALDNTLNIDNQTLPVRKAFFRVIEKGHCNVYGYYGYTPDAAATGALFGAVGALASANSMEELICIQSGGSDLWAVQALHFKRDMSMFFANCPKILDKVQSKQYTFESWKNMLKDYNNNGCK